MEQVGYILLYITLLKQQNSMPLLLFLYNINYRWNLQSKKGCLTTGSCHTTSRAILLFCMCAHALQPSQSIAPVIYRCRRRQIHTTAMSGPTSHAHALFQHGYAFAAWCASMEPRLVMEEKLSSLPLLHESVEEIVTWMLDGWGWTALFCLIPMKYEEFKKLKKV